MAVGALFLLGMGSALVAAHDAREAEARRLTAYENALRAEPGIVVTSAVRRHGRYRLSGFRDPLAADPAAVLARHGYPPAQLDFSSFESLDPRIVDERVRRALRPPPGVRVRLTAGGIVRLSGEAPSAWIERATFIGPALGGVQRVDTTELISSERVGALRSAVARVEELDPRFRLGSSDLAPDQRTKVEIAAARLQRLGVLSAELHARACVTVVGHTDASGGAERNATLGAERARVVARALEEQGVDPAALRPKGGGIWGVGAPARNVRLRVEIRPEAAVCGGGDP
jgi:OOP family OmpA-OmpF porin